MAEQFLHRTNVKPSFEQMRRETVPERRVCGPTRFTMPANRAAWAVAEAKFGTVAEEADECLEWLEYPRDAEILAEAGLIDEACQLTRVFVASLKISKANTNRIKAVPKELMALIDLLRTFHSLLFT